MEYENFDYLTPWDVSQHAIRKLIQNMKTRYTHIYQHVMST